MLKPIVFATALATIALAAQAQDGPPPAAPEASSAPALSLVGSSDVSSSASSSATPDPGTEATLDLPGASASSSSGSVPSKPVVAPPDKKTLQRINDAIVAYIRDQRGWMDGTYKIGFEGYDNGLVIMRIDLTQGDNAYNFVGAEGQPFKVEIDPQSLKIEDERY